MSGESLKKIVRNLVANGVDPEAIAATCRGLGADPSDVVAEMTEAGAYNMSAAVAVNEAEAESEAKPSTSKAKKQSKPKQSRQSGPKADVTFPAEIVEKAQAVNEARSAWYEARKALPKGIKPSEPLPKALAQTTSDKWTAQAFRTLKTMGDRRVVTRKIQGKHCKVSLFGDDIAVYTVGYWIWLEADGRLPKAAYEVVKALGGRLNKSRSGEAIKGADVWQINPSIKRSRKSRNGDPRGNYSVSADAD